MDGGHSSGKLPAVAPAGRVSLSGGGAPLSSNSGVAPSISSSSSSSWSDSKGGAAGVAPSLPSPHGGATATAAPNAAAGVVKSKLTVLSNRFTGFEEQLHLQRQKKRADDKRKLVAVEQRIEQLTASMALESKNRSQSLTALQSWLNDRIEKWTETIERPMVAKLDALNARIDTLHVKMDGLEKKQIEDRETFPKVIDARCTQLLTEIKDFKMQFESNRRSREEQEKRLAAKITEVQNKLHEQFVVEKSASEQRATAIRAELADEVETRTKGVDAVRKQIAIEIAPLREALAKESHDREHADEELVQAVNHYTAALQDGIKIVSGAP